MPLKILYLVTFLSGGYMSRVFGTEGYRPAGLCPGVYVRWVFILGGICPYTDLDRYICIPFNRRNMHFI